LQLIAKTMHGMEAVLKAELDALGAQQTEILTRAVQFEGDLRMLYRANYELRTALRILKPLFQFTCKNEQELYKGIYAHDWLKLLVPEGTLAVNATCSSEIFTHSHYVALKTKDAIVDRFRDKTGRRPSVDLIHPDLLIHIHIWQDQCSVSLDSSGESLHRRGYRRENLQAPLNEVLAAGLLSLAGWPKPLTLTDPMCGSGTLPIEAAMMAAGIPAQHKRRHFAFHRWPDFDRELWEDVKQKAWPANPPADMPAIYASDIQPNAIRMAQINAREAGVYKYIRFEVANFDELKPHTETGMLIFNPPYDERLPLEEVADFYNQIGQNLKYHFNGHEAWVFSGNLSAVKHIGLRPGFKAMLFNGGIEARFLRFDMYQGSKKRENAE
jgi:putative N6-adenine-specific DNA methylase